MNKVGNRKVLFYTTILVQDAEVGWIEAPLAYGGATLKLSVRFEGLVPGTTQPTFAWRMNDGAVDARFAGWKNALGTVFAEPIKIGDIDQKPMSLQVAHYYTGGFNLLHVWIYLADAT
jgi:hypothetical protein